MDVAQFDGAVEPGSACEEPIQGELEIDPVVPFAMGDAGGFGCFAGFVIDDSIFAEQWMAVDAVDASVEDDCTAFGIGEVGAFEALFGVLDAPAFACGVCLPAGKGAEATFEHSELNIDGR